jgi:hypothetical protein
VTKKKLEAMFLELVSSDTPKALSISEKLPSMTTGMGLRHFFLPLKTMTDARGVSAFTEDAALSPESL